MPDIHPTHTCFDDTTEILAYELKKKPDSFRELVLVHAICLLPEGKPYVHAWVERRDDAFFMGIVHQQKLMFVVPKKEYHKGLQIRQQTRYPLLEVLKNNARYGSCGPWEPEYIALCKDFTGDKTLTI